MASYGYGDAPRQERDFYVTPAWAVEKLLEVETFTGRVWEPACGDGAISRVLTERGYDVFSSDVHDYGFPGCHVVDFRDAHYGVDNVVTNPPYKLARQFVELALQRVTGKVALLLRLQFLEGKTRWEMFTDTPPARVHIFSERIGFNINGVQYTGGMVAHAWFVWEQGHVGSPTLNWLRPRDT